VLCDINGARVGGLTQLTGIDPIASPQFDIGGANNTYAEVLVYNSALNGILLTDLTNYLLTKYEI
jgi:hypothetical protein